MARPIASPAARSVCRSPGHRAPSSCAWSRASSNCSIPSKRPKKLLRTTSDAPAAAAAGDACSPRSLAFSAARTALYWAIERYVKMRINRAGSLKVASLTARAAISSRAVRFQATLDPASQNLTADNDGRLGVVGAGAASEQAPIESARAASATFDRKLERYDMILSTGWNR